MSADLFADVESDEPRITIEDVKHRAVAVRDLAVSEAKRSTNEMLHERATQTVIIGVAAVLAITSLAYYLGSRKCLRQPPPPPRY